jgi:YidC/Oxa1 family membrane protein insertase
MVSITANVLQPLVDVFENILRFFHDSIGASWGLSIILLTIVVRAALLPLAVKQFN